MDRVIEDKELGRLVVRDNVRAKRLVFRTKADAIYISIPLGVTMREVKEAIEKLRPRLLDSRQKLVRPLIDLNYRIRQNTSNYHWLVVNERGFWHIQSWERCGLSVLQQLILQTRICRIGFEK